MASNDLPSPLFFKWISSTFNSKIGQISKRITVNNFKLFAEAKISFSFASQGLNPAQVSVVLPFLCQGFEFLEAPG